MSLRTVGRWLYHVITSTDKRPYLESSLSDLEALAGDASAQRNCLLLLEILEELTYRLASRSRRDIAKQKIVALIKEFEGVDLTYTATRDEISAARRVLIQKYENDAKASLEAEAIARQEAEQKARQEAEERARLEAEARARREAEEKARQEAEERARQGAEAKARQEAEEKARQEAEERARQEAEAIAKQEAEEKAREEAEERARLEAEVKARQEAEEKARQEVAAAEQARKEEEARQKADAEQASADQRPYLEANLAELEALAGEASARRDCLLLLEILEELTYRPPSPSGRDIAKQKIVAVIKEFEGINLTYTVDRDEISEARRVLIQKYENVTNARLEAEAIAKQEAEEKARQEAEERARLEAEVKARQEAEEKARQEVAAAEQARKKEEARQKADAEQASADTRPYLEASIAKLEALAGEASARRDCLLLLEILEELTYRPISQSGRDIAKQKIVAVIKEFEGIDLTYTVNRDQISAARRVLIQKYENATNARLEAEAIARQEAEEKARKKAEEKARLEAEAKAKQEAEEKARQEAEGRARLEAEAKAKQEAEEKARQEAEERARLEAEAHRRVQEEEQARQAAEAERLRLEQERQAAAAEAEDWQKWKEGDWNRCLLRYCFLNLEEETRIGVPSSVEDLRFAVRDSQANPTELADAFIKSIIAQAERHNVKPAKLFKKRAENWNPATPLDPPFFAFLWATCLISQGYPNPYEAGQFHMRYQRVFGPEQRSTFKSLILGWEKLSQWLEQEKVFNGEGHRELTLPSELGNKTNIGYSWYLSFPSRNDRAELASVIQQLLDDEIAIVPLTAHALFTIKRIGRFGAEFTRELEKQTRKASETGRLDEWFAAIIKHEYKQLQTAVDSTPDAARRSGRTLNPELTLQLDLEDPSQIQLFLPTQDVNGLEESIQSVTFCTLDPVGTEHPWNPRKGTASIGEDVCKVVSEMVPAWTWKLRSGSCSSYTLRRWSCAGIEPGDLPILCFCAESGQRVTGYPIITESAEVWFFAPKHLQLSSNDSVEILDELRWGVSLKGWRGYLLRLTQPKAELLWQGSEESTQQTFSLHWSFVANVTPVLRGSLIEKKNRIYTSAPSLWIPPLSVPVELILTIKDLSTNQLLSVTSDPVALPASDQWAEVDLTKCINSESRFSILVQPEWNHPDLPARWRTTFQVHNPYERRDDDELFSPLLTCLHNDSPTSRQLDAHFRSFFYEDASDFWLARWLLERLWPMESLDLIVSNGIGSYQDTLVADCEGTLEISAAIYRYTLQGEGNSISIVARRQGEESAYVLARTGEESQSTKSRTSITSIPLQDADGSTEASQASPSRRRPVDFIIIFQPRFTARRAKKQVEDFMKITKQLIAEAGIPSDELYPQNLDNDVWIRVMNRDHLSEIDNLLQGAQEKCGFQILKQQRR